MTLRRINSLLVVGIVAINLYVVLLPLWPSIWYWLTNDEGRATALTRELNAPPDKPIPADAQILKIPRLQLEETVHEVPSMDSVRNDLWRRPATSTPDNGGNTVIVGHRFTYTNPTGVLYHLDKVRQGDTLALDWHGKRYTYRVTDIRTVAPTATEVEAPTDEPQLTLYTCTPLWNPKERLVVTAQLEETYE